METLDIGADIRLANPEWLRGPVRLDSGWLVLDADRSERYSPLDMIKPEQPYDLDLPFALARIKTAQDALEFARHYGLLRSGPTAPTHRERVETFLDAGQRLAWLLGLHATIRRAIGGDNDALELLRYKYAPRWMDADDVQLDAGSLIADAIAALASSLNEGLRDCRVMVMALGDDGTRIAFIFDGPDLLTLAYTTAANLIGAREPLRICEECERTFLVTDQRQRFCGKPCADRNRQRRWLQNRKATPVQAPPRDRSR